MYWPQPYGVTGASFRTFGPVSRFDHQRRPAPFPAARDDPDRGIFYAAPEFECSLAEAFGDRWVVQTDDAWLAVLRLTSDLHLLDLRGKGAIHAGSVYAVTTDGDRAITQDWGRYWYEHPDFGSLDGLIYPGAHTGQDAIAVWERAAGKYRVRLDAPLDDSAVYAEVIVAADHLDMPVDP